MCPIVPIFRCGLLRSNFSFAIAVSAPQLVYSFPVRLNLMSDLHEFECLPLWSSRRLDLHPMVNSPTHEHCSSYIIPSDHHDPIVTKVATELLWNDPNAITFLRNNKGRKGTPFRNPISQSDASDFRKRQKKNLLFKLRFDTHRERSPAFDTPARIMTFIFATSDACPESRTSSTRSRGIVRLKFPREDSTRTIQRPLNMSATTAATRNLLPCFSNKA